jgi:hypothetical protein
MPMAAMSPAFMPALRSASRQTLSTPHQISRASCSTQPSAGKCCLNSSWCEATAWPAASKTMARVLVVPWSMASRWVALMHGSLSKAGAAGALL